MVVPDQLRGAIAHDEECSIVREFGRRFCLGCGKGKIGNGTDLRIIKPFAPAYIAERIARDAGLVDDYWGNTGRAVANAYRQYSFQVAQGDPVRVIDIFLKGKHKISDVFTTVPTFAKQFVDLRRFASDRCVPH